jgi:acetyltransferase-like isoleucine patch superfamily enzyme
VNFKLIAGGILSYLYNYWLRDLPLRRLRETYLKAYLGGLGASPSIQMGCRFLNGRKVFIGDRNVINFGCLFDGRHYSIRIGADVSIGPEATLLTLGHDPQSPHFADKGGDIVVGDRAWIAYRAIILPGVTIGEGAVIGAGSVVTKDVEPYTIVAGNPAEIVKKRSRALKYALDFQPFLL